MAAVEPEGIRFRDTGTDTETGDRQDCQRISGKRRRKSMAVLSVPGGYSRSIRSNSIDNLGAASAWPPKRSAL